MRLEVLISCMHENDFSIVKRTNIQTDAVVVNQCDKDLVEEFSFINKHDKECRIVFIHTTERGLSRSRNMALSYSTADLCLLCDDDEGLVDDYESIIINAFEKTPSADIIAFNILRPTKKPYETIHKLNFVESLMVSSVHITFRRERILMNRISFDVLLGSGTGNGGGEDTKFMRDCRKKGLSQWSNPSFLGILKDTGKSQWFHGYSKQFFIDLGWGARRVLGEIMGLLKVLHFLVKHWKEYRKEISFFSAICYSYSGWRMKKSGESFE